MRAALYDRYGTASEVLRIEEIERIFHGVGALMYYDGANLNAVCGLSRPGDMGFDIVHINLHKTFSQPHGGGGPGGGPIVVRRMLEPVLPLPAVVPAGAAGWIVSASGAELGAWPAGALTALGSGQ